MALIELKSNLANFRANFTTPSVESQAVKKLNQPTPVKEVFKPTDSQLDVDAIPTAYNRRTKFTKRFVDRSIFNRDDEFILKYTGRTRFTTKFVNKFSQFNIDSSPSKFSPGMFIPSKFTDKNRINISKFNIDSTPDKFSSVGTSRLSIPKFVNRSLFNIDSTPSKFSSVGVSNLSKPTFINSSKFNLDENPSKFSSTGIYAPSKFNSISIVNASKFNIDSIPTKFAANGKFQSRYTNSSIVNDRINNLYKSFNERFNLRDTAYNYSYINHPLILRGIQRKGNERPNRWGVDGLVNFDSGLVRGGITAAVDRVAADTFRISKWLTSPKGLLWITKQIGLGLSNPSVERGPGSSIAGIQQTRIHTGLAVLGSVPSHATGIHLTRHGIPFKNKFASYEEVLKYSNSSVLFDDKASPFNNRLIRLRGKLFDNQSFKTDNVNEKSANLGAKILGIARKAFKSLNQENVLEYLGGPQSVYGIGFTTIRRTTDTRSDRLYYQGLLRGIYSTNNQYASKLRALTGNTQDVNLEQSAAAKGGLDLFLPEFEKQNKEREIFAVDNRKNSLHDYYNLSIQDKLTGLDQAKVNIYKPRPRFSKNYKNSDSDAPKLISRKKFSDTLYAGFQRAKTGKTADPDKSETKQNLEDLEASKTSLKQITTDINSSDIRRSKIKLPNSDVLKDNPFNRLTTGTNKLERNLEGNINLYSALSYSNIRKFAQDRSEGKASFNDFRSKVTGNNSFIGKQDEKYYEDFNLEKRYGFTKAGPGEGVTARGPDSFIIKGNQFAGTAGLKHQLSNHSKFSGDRINAIDYISEKINPDSIYTDNAKDFIKFYFADGEMNSAGELKDVMVFRASITGLSDTFSPSWGSVQIMGRPDSVYRYDSFERSISFSFKAYALSRSEMIPMWRKLNFLASYTMPDFIGGYAAGPFMRLTLGDLFHKCPGFIESLSYTVPDDTPWDIGDDSVNNEDAKQLPTMIDVSVGYKIIGTHRPLNRGKVYALTPNDAKTADQAVAGDWLAGATSYEKRTEETKDLDPTKELQTNDDTQLEGAGGQIA